MKLHILAVGRLRHGPERDLIGTYLDRALKTGRALGIEPTGVIEVEDRKGGGQAAEAKLLAKSVPDGAFLIAMDERGRNLTSPEFACQIARVRDDGTRDLVMMIGGADGLTVDLRTQCNMAMSFGKMVWPHMLARVMLSEQIYRACSILAGSPYHRI